MSYCFSLSWVPESIYLSIILPSTIAKITNPFFASNSSLEKLSCLITFVCFWSPCSRIICLGRVEQSILCCLDCARSKRWFDLCIRGVIHCSSAFGSQPFMLPYSPFSVKKKITRSQLWSADMFTFPPQKPTRASVPPLVPAEQRLNLTVTGGCRCPDCSWNSWTLPVPSQK